MQRLVFFITLLGLSVSWVNAMTPLPQGSVSFINCSGFLFALENFKSSDKALVMTNGHCLSMWKIKLKPNEAIMDKKAKKRLRIIDEQGQRQRFKTERLVYATMTKTDMAIYQLKETYAELKEKGIRPMLLARAAPRPNTLIYIPSAYKKGIWYCQLDGLVHELEEQGYFFDGSLRLDVHCKPPGGTSGSPIVDSHTGLVVGINNTINKKGKKCKANNPCERNEQGVLTALKGQAYGQRTEALYHCLSKDGVLAFKQESCPLPRPE